MFFRITVFITITFSSVIAFSSDEKTIVEQFNKENLDVFSSLVFIKGKPQKAVNVPAPKFEIVSNNDAFPDEMSKFSKDYPDYEFVKGRLLQLDANTPIGYIIYRPKSDFEKRDVKAVLIVAYGGGTKETALESRLSYFEWPGRLNDSDRYLLNNDIAVVKTNLVDLLTEGYQDEMPKDVHERLHASINKLFEQIHTKPAQIHTDLASLTGKKIFLMGGSFGGRTAVMQSELYPGTFSGYISHDGSLDASSRDHLNTMSKGAICSDEKIEKIRDPVLILQNLDDNRVPADIAFNWYDKAIASGKEKLVRLHLTKIGNALEPDEPTIKGHLLPRGNDAFEQYMQTILGFMLHGVESIPATSEWLLTKSRLSLSLAESVRTKKYSEDEIFLSAAYRYFKENEKEAADSGWNPVVKILPNTFLGPGYEDLYETKFSGKYAPEISEANWKKLQPLLFGIASMTLSSAVTRESKTLKDTLDQDPHRSEALANGLIQALPSFLSFLNEKGIDTIGLSVSKLANNPDLQEKYLQFLTTPRFRPRSNMCYPGSISRGAYDYLLLSLFRGNIGKIHDFLGAETYQFYEKKWGDKSEQLRIKFNKILKTRADEKVSK